MLWPNGSISRPRITSGFGTRVHPVTKKVKKHRGVDLVGFSTVRAVAAGTVYKVGTPVGWSGGGTQVWIKHNGFISRSLHLVSGSTLVTPGQWVSEGQAIGRMGRTGTATGVHLHLEIVVNGRQIDPLPYIAARLTPEARPSGGGSTTIPTQEDDMFIAIVRKQDWYMVVGGKACLLGAASGARTSGAPILNFVDDWAVAQLKTVVTGIK